MILEPREPKKILYDLCILIGRRHLLAKHLFELISNGLISENVKSKVFGAIEFIISEALAYILDTKLVANIDINEIEGLPKRYVSWNGKVMREEGIVLFEMAPPGIPDIEYHVKNNCNIIEVTLGSHERTILYEIGELLKHKARIHSNIDKRILVVLLQRNRIIEIEKYIARELNNDKILVLPLHVLIEALRNELTIENITDLLRIESRTKNPCRDVLLDLRQTMERRKVKEINEYIEFLISQDLLALPSIVYSISKHGLY